MRSEKEIREEMCKSLYEMSKMATEEYRLLINHKIKLLQWVLDE